MPITSSCYTDSTESAYITDAVSTAHVTDVVNTVMDITPDTQTDIKVSTNISTDFQESTNITIDSGFNVSTKRRSTWKFDICASSHITSTIGNFETLRSDNRTLKVGGDHLLSDEGKGTCILHPLLPDGSSTIIRLRDVLFVPSLKHDLLSWNSLRSSFSCEMSGKDVYEIGRAHV